MRRSKESTGLDWHKIFDENAEALVLYARQWVRSHADAEDVVQEAFIKVFETKKLGPDENPVPFLYKAVKWISWDWTRRNIRRVKRETKAHQGVQGYEMMFETNLETIERIMPVQQAIQELPEEQREVLIMKIWGDMTFKLIGESVGISQNTAGSRYRYALGSLRKKLRKSLKP